MEIKKKIKKQFKYFKFKQTVKAQSDRLLSGCFISLNVNAYCWYCTSKYVSLLINIQINSVLCQVASKVVVFFFLKPIVLPITLLNAATKSNYSKLNDKASLQKP